MPRVLGTNCEELDGQGESFDTSTCNDVQKKILQCFRFILYHDGAEEPNDWGILYTYSLPDLKKVMCEQLGLDASTVADQSTRKWVIANLPDDITVERPPHVDGDEVIDPDDPNIDPFLQHMISDLEFLEFPDRYLAAHLFEDARDEQ